MTIEYNHQRGSDVYLVLKCNNEDFKYIYIEEKDVSDLMKFEWSNLSTDLEVYVISLPEKEEWIGKIKMINCSYPKN